MAIKKYIMAVLSIMLGVSILLNFILYHKNETEKYDIIGTYCTGDGKSENDEYITFMSEKEYCYYQQNNVMDKGEYSALHENIYKLSSLNKEISPFQILLTHNQIYEFHSGSNIKIYKKISDTPILINVDQN